MAHQAERQWNPMLAVDLHVHSNRSDGSFSPAQLVDYAREKGLAAFALTDHDTIDGLDEALQYAERLAAGQADSIAAAQAEHSPGAAAGKGRGADGSPCAKDRQAVAGTADTDGAFGAMSPSRPPQDIKGPAEGYADRGLVPEVIPGIEFSTEYRGQDVHVLGLYIDYRNPAFVQKLRDFVDSRTTRNRKMCRLLTEAGMPVTYEELTAMFPDAVITRAHYARYMLEQGYVKNMSEAFDRYIGDGCPCFLPREKVTPVDAVKLVLSAGGIPILAHPVLYNMSDGELDVLTACLKEAGLIGLEAVYSTYTAADERRMRGLAKKYGLAVSGGSDFHGANKPGLDLGTGYGSLYVPACLLEDLKRIRREKDKKEAVP